MVNTACNNNQLSHMLPSSQQQDQPHKLVYDQVDCSICLEPLQQPEKQHITLINCNHTFHQTCILYAMKAQYDFLQESLDHISMQNITLEQIQAHLTCPCCRKPILDDHLLYHSILIKDIILQTVYYEKLQEFHKILNYIDDINALKYPNDNSLLHIVVEAHNDLKQDDQLSIAMATALINKNMNINMKNSQHWTPLHIAAHQKDTTMITFLLEHHANINAHNDWSWTPLHLAIQSGDIKTIQLFIDKGADINAPANLGFQMKNGQLTPIYLAIYYQQMDALKLLINHHANINTKSIFDFTPLHFAALCSNIHFRHLVPRDSFDSEPSDYKPYIRYLKKILHCHNDKNSFGQTYKTLQKTDKFHPQLIQLFKDIDKD